MATVWPGMVQSIGSRGLRRDLVAEQQHQLLQSLTCLVSFLIETLR